MTVQLLTNAIQTIHQNVQNAPRYDVNINGTLHIVVAPQSSVVLTLWLNGIPAVLNQGNSLSGGAWYDFDGIEVLQGDEIQITGNVDTQGFLRMYVKSVF
ncbi:hypothetical protein MTIV3_ORF23 [Metallosphaera turreted icosahedral virus 3]|nr:hypothetical protein MTIV3_ORF23 [Metallosphaera turreted icosahedral virus 3]